VGAAWNCSSTTYNGEHNHAYPPSTEPFVTCCFRVPHDQSRHHLQPSPCSVPEQAVSLIKRPEHHPHLGHMDTTLTKPHTKMHPTPRPGSETSLQDGRLLSWYCRLLSLSSAFERDGYEFLLSGSVITSRAFGQKTRRVLQHDYQSDMRDPSTPSEALFLFSLALLRSSVNYTHMS